MPNHSEEHSAKDKKFVKSVFASVVHLYGRSARGATRDKCSKNRGDDRETRRSTKQTRLASLFNSNLVKLWRCKVSFNWINLSNVKSRCQKTFHNVTSLSISKHQKDEFDSFPQNLTQVSTGLATLMILMMMMIMIIIRTMIMMAAMSMMKGRISIERCKSVCEPKRVLTNHVRGQRLIRPQFRAPVMQAF